MDELLYDPLGPDRGSKSEGVQGVVPFSSPENSVFGETLLPVLTLRLPGPLPFCSFAFHLTVDVSGRRDRSPSRPFPPALLPFPVDCPLTERFTSEL